MIDRCPQFSTNNSVLVRRSDLTPEFLTECTLWIAIAMILRTFNVRKSDGPDPKTGQPFQYDDSDAAFSGEVRSNPHSLTA
jgi:hypothetical protein